MVEFYQAYTDYRGLMELTEQLLRQLAIDVIGSTSVPFGDVELDFGSIRRLTMREAVVEYWNGPDKPSQDQVRDPAWLTTQTGKANAGEALALLFEEHAERKLIQPTFIYDFPVEISPLAKNKPDEPAFVERFELIIAGMEIGNAYTELSTIPWSNAAGLTPSAPCWNAAMKRRIRWTRTTCAPCLTDCRPRVARVSGLTASRCY